MQDYSDWLQTSAKPSVVQVKVATLPVPAEQKTVAPSGKRKSLLVLAQLGPLCGVIALFATAVQMDRGNLSFGVADSLTAKDIPSFSQASKAVASLDEPRDAARDTLTALPSSINIRTFDLGDAGSGSATSVAANQPEAPTPVAVTSVPQRDVIGALPTAPPKTQPASIADVEIRRSIAAIDSTPVILTPEEVEPVVGNAPTPLRPVVEEAEPVSKFDNVRPGMTLDQVRAILGSNADEIVRDGDDVEANVRVFSWRVADGSTIVVVFKDDVMDAKAQYGTA